MRISDWSSDVCSSDLELIRIYNNLDLADSEGLEHRTLTLAVRLQFAFAARMSEILTLQWDWIDIGNRRVAWPTSKTGSISKPLSKEAALLLANAPILEDEYGQPSPYVCPSVVRPTTPRSEEHTSELQTLLRSSYALFCLK